MKRRRVPRGVVDGTETRFRRRRTRGCFERALSFTRKDAHADESPTPTGMALSENSIVGLCESVFVATRAF